MGDLQQDVARHYGHGGLLDRIKAGLAVLGSDPEKLNADDLKPVDEFHIGGAEATADLIDQLDLDADTTVLDIGCGIGGTARFVASRHGCKVSGVDLTPEFVECAQALSEMVGLGGNNSFEVGSATALPFGDDSFDVALLIHVGMNIPDKRAVMREARRVLRSGGTFATYEVMRTGPGDLTFPVPWADAPDTSFVEEPGAYRQAAEEAGFTVVSERERSAFALAFFAELARRMRDAAATPPLGLHLLMGETTKARIGNMVANIQAGRIAPVELILKAPA